MKQERLPGIKRPRGRPRKENPMSVKERQKRWMSRQKMEGKAIVTLLVAKETKEGLKNLSRLSGLSEKELFARMVSSYEKTQLRKMERVSSFIEKMLAGDLSWGTTQEGYQSFLKAIKKS